MENLGLDPYFWRGRRVLLTGHTGFKGAWLALWLEALGAEVTALALPPEPDTLWPRLDPPPAARTAEIDIRDADAIAIYAQSAKPDIVLHLAAQSLVWRGYRDPAATFATNVQGSINLLEALRHVGSLQALLIVTSDKVYHHKSAVDSLSEDDMLGGNDPYSASKVACEMAVAAYREAVYLPKGVAIATARAGNVIGGGDVADNRLLPDLVRAISAGQPIRLRTPEALRPWLHVLDSLCGYLLYVQHLAMRPGDMPTTLNFGPGAGSRRSVRVVIETACNVWGKPIAIASAPPLPGESKPLWLSAERAAQTLGWRPRLDFETGIRWTVDWWRGLAQGQSARALCAQQIASYAELAR